MATSPVQSPFPKSAYRRNAKIYRILANPKRLEILNLIKDKELTVGQLVGAVGARKANISQHLGVLRQLRLVKVRKNSKYSHYTISNPDLVRPCKILNDLWEDNNFDIS